MSSGTGTLLPFIVPSKTEIKSANLHILAIKEHFICWYGAQPSDPNLFLYFWFGFAYDISIKNCNPKLGKMMCCLLEILTQMSFFFTNKAFIHLNTVHLFGISIIPIFNNSPKSGCKIVISVEPTKKNCVLKAP